MNPKFYYGTADSFGAGIERQAKGNAYVCCFIEHDDSHWVFLCASDSETEVRCFANGAAAGWMARATCDPPETARAVPKPKYGLGT